MTLADGLWVFIVPLAITICIEVTAGLIMGVRKRESIIWILLINIITNLTLNMIIVILYNLMSTHLVGAGRMTELGVRVLLIVIIYAALEPLVVWTEYLFYRKNMTEEKHPLRLSLVLNISSVIGGIICQNLF